jgi:hypothetical protein
MNGLSHNTVFFLKKLHESSSSNGCSHLGIAVDFISCAKGMVCRLQGMRAEVKTTLHTSIFTLICDSKIYAFDMALKSEVGTGYVSIYEMSQKGGLAVEYVN